MKAFAGLLAVLLLLSGAAGAQTAATQPTGSEQQATTQAAAQAPAEVAAASAGVVPAARFAAGAKVFVEPMDGFGQLVAEAIVKKKVPVVLVRDRAQADFVLSGEAHVHRRGFFTGFVLDTTGKGSVWIEDARTADRVWGCKFSRVDQMEAEGYVYQTWAGGCAKHLKKALEKK